MSFVVAFAWAVAPDVAQAKHNNNKYHYDIDGTLEMKPAALDAYNSPQPLANVQVRISGKIRGGTWGHWATKRTRGDGSFSYKTERGKPGTFNFSERKLRIQVKFQSQNLEVWHHGANSSLTKVIWYTIYESGWKRGMDLDLNGTFEKGGSKALGRLEPRRHAQLWYLYRDVSREMSNLGHPFTDKIKVKYPHDGIAGDKVENSYANPFNKVIFIVNNSQKDQFRDDILVHELMHIWAYQHTGGEGNVGAYFADPTNGFDTHGRVGQSYVAVHEGIAEFVKDELMDRMFGESLDQPFSRHAFGSNFSNFDKVNNFNDVVHHDKGWWTLFNLMGRRKLYKYEFRTTNNRLDKASCGTCGCNWGRMSFQELLDVIDGSHTDDMNYSDFFQRIRNEVRGVDRGDQRMYRKLLDPNSNYEPTSDICSGCSSERCNGKDDDCDEQVDENLTRSCGKGTGQCRQGTQTCKNGSWGNCRNNKGPSRESCNNQDDDCDGSVDEALRQICGRPIGQCRTGVEVCNRGQWSRCRQNVGPSAETCDSEDDDCDGAVDEGLDCSGCSGDACAADAGVAGADARASDMDGDVSGAEADAPGADAGSPLADTGAPDVGSTTDASRPDDASEGGTDAATAGGIDASRPSDTGLADGAQSDVDSAAPSPDAGRAGATDGGVAPGADAPASDDPDDEVENTAPSEGCACGSTPGRPAPIGIAVAVLLGLAWVRRRMT